MSTTRVFHFYIINIKFTIIKSDTEAQKIRTERKVRGPQVKVRNLEWKLIDPGQGVLK